MSPDGFEVLVHEVIAAIPTLPCFSESFTAAGTCSCTLGSSTPIAAGLPPSCSHFALFAAVVVVAAVLADFGLVSEGKALVNDSPACERPTRPCGRFGPARLGSTVARSSVGRYEHS